MPIYEYECLKCAKTFEEMQKINDPLISECRFCGGDVRRLLSPPAIIFKGSGWYATDFPTTDRKKGLEKEKKDTGKSQAAPACSADCKNPSCS